MQKLIVANWKMNPDSLEQAVSLAKKIEQGILKTKAGSTPSIDSRRTSSPQAVEVVIAPPFPFLESVKHQLSSVKLGAQDVFWQQGGPYTGEVSAAMLKNLGVSYVIVGHSERRHWLGETDEMINKKVSACLKAGLKVVLCVGEPTERGLTRTSRGLTRNRKSAKNYVRKQLEIDLRGAGFLLNKKSPRRSAFGLRESALVVAYEPAWAISTGKHGKADTPQNALDMIKFIKSFLHPPSSILHPRVLYGGSVTSQNIGDFIQYKEIDGALVGGASLKAEEFNKIILRACS